MRLSELKNSLEGYRDKEITFLVDEKECKLDFLDSTIMEGKIVFGLKE